MKKIFVVFFSLLSLNVFSQQFTKEEIARWEKQASQVTIIRDKWGIPHIYGKTDADVVFGLLYAQCEDDFPRVEMNFIEKLGRMSEVKGESELAADLLLRMMIDTSDAITDYNAAPDWLKKLLNAHADGINYYLYKHPNQKRALLSRFQPWFHLLWTDGSIGAINTSDISESEIKKLYIDSNAVGFIKQETEDEKLTGSNGFAFAPFLTESGNPILYINPHVTFYFRPEVHVVSEEGLNAYGAVTWGQFFVYQGFNEKCGWMHTSSYADVGDTYIEKISKQKNNEWVYEYEKQLKPVTKKTITLRYKTGNKIQKKAVTVLYTHHGPVMARREGQWLSMKANNRSMTSLIQSWQRTKARNFAEYKEVMGLMGNTSNNTVYADYEGNIAYWHGNYLPVRDPKMDWSKPVDGSTSATEWNGLHQVEESVHLYNPSNGWIQNCNSTPFTAAGINSPKKENFPPYMAPDGENFRGINAARIMDMNSSKYNLDKVIAVGYDTYLAAFEVLVPALVKSFEAIKSSDSLYTLLQEPIAQLKAWDFRCNIKSIPTTLAVEWGQKVSPFISRMKVPGIENADQVQKTKQFAASAVAEEMLFPFADVIRNLKTRFGTWQVPWGDLNRFQRISSDIDNKFDDNKPSYPVPFASSHWGMLPSYNSKTFPGTKKRYGVSGNSFICAVEFGRSVKAKSLLAGGQSGNPFSPHFFDQGEMYAQGKFKDVLFYKEDVLKNADFTYHPGKEDAR